MLIVRLTSLSLVAGFVALEVPAMAGTSTLNSTRRDYEDCVVALQRAQIPTAQAANSCAKTFKPDDLAICVQRTTRDGKIAGDAALLACRRVRRPLELANCVFDIRTRLTEAQPLLVLDRCRRSLLPERYASCVVGINRGAKPRVEELDTCIDASDFPRELDPTFIPFSSAPGDLNPFPPISPAPVIPVAPETQI
jgi:hypothetical protein